MEKDTQQKMVNATVQIEGFSWTYLVNEEARFHVYLPPGGYKIAVRCHGYQDYKMVHPISKLIIWIKLIYISILNFKKILKLFEF